MSKHACQIRPPEGGLSYAPYRDIAHNFPGIVKTALNGMAEQDWTYLIGDYLQQNNVTEEDMVKAAQALAKYTEACMKLENKEPLDAMKESGFLDVPIPAQVAVMIKIGETFTSFYHHCVREAHAANEIQLGLKDLLEAAESLVLHMSTCRRGEQTEGQLA